MSERELAIAISTWIAQKVQAAHRDGVVLGVSGGIDSAVVAALASHAQKVKVLGLILPCKSSEVDEECAWQVARWLGLDTQRVDLAPVYDELLTVLPPGDRLAQANIKPRLRMITLYHFARAYGRLVAGTGNRSEISVGYFTKYGDGGADILPIGSLLKRDVRRLARYLGVPQTIIERPPTAGLWPGQTDEEEMGLSYDELDRALLALEAGRPEEAPGPILARVEEMMAGSDHKRKPIPIFPREEVLRLMDN